MAKLSGIGCSSKTPTYFLGNSHGFNSVHGRMPSVLTGAALANRDLIYLGVSGDGDSASIGLGQFAHVMRRGVNMVYIVENNGVYGLTKGQFSATADKGSKSKRGAVNSDEPIDLVDARADARRDVRRARLLRRQGAARAADQGRGRSTRAPRSSTSSARASRSTTIPGSTKSYDYVREHNEAVNFLDFISPRAEITTSYAPGDVRSIVLHDGGSIRLRKLRRRLRSRATRSAALAYLEAPARSGRGRDRAPVPARGRAPTCTTCSTPSTRRSTRSPTRTSCRAARRWRRSTRRCAERHSELLDIDRTA